MQAPSMLPEPFLAHPQLLLARIEPAGGLLPLYGPPVGQHEESPRVVSQQREYALECRQPLAPLDAGSRLGNCQERVTVPPEPDARTVGLLEGPVTLDVPPLCAQGAHIGPQHQWEVAGHTPAV